MQGLDFALFETELQVSSRPQSKRRKVLGRGGRAVHKQVSSVQADRLSTSNDDPLTSFITWKLEVQPHSKPWKLSDSRKESDPLKSFITWKLEAQPPSKFVPWNEPISIEDVRKSYERAKDAGQLQSSSLPQLETELADTPRTERWNPYILTKWLLRHALLDDGKLENLRNQFKWVKQKVPKATQWTAETEKRGLTPTDLYELLRTAFTSGTACTRSSNNEARSRQSTANSEMPYILRIAATLIHHANRFEALPTSSQRTTAIARIVGYALMRVSEAVGEVTTTQAKNGVKALFKGNDDWQKRSRNLACFWCWAMANLPEWKGRELALYLILVDNDGEQGLRRLFQPALPVAVGEFVSLLNSREYSQAFSSSITIPGVIEMVCMLLRGYASDVTICRALGCPDSYLNGNNSAGFLFTFAFSSIHRELDSPTDERTEESNEFVDMDADLDDTFRYIYGDKFEDLETLFPFYEFSISSPI